MLIEAVGSDELRLPRYTNLSEHSDMRVVGFIPTKMVNLKHGCHIDERRDNSKHW